MKDLFNTVLYDPLYNALVFLIDILPGGDVGFAIIILTIGVKFVLLPIAHRSVKTQTKMREVEPELKEIKEKHKDNKQKQAEAVMELYKKHGVNPFSGCLLLILQLPVIFALYFVFLKGFPINADSLYMFVPMPEQTNFMFLGLIDLMSKSLSLALLAGATQYYQIKLSFPVSTPSKQETGKTLSFQEEFAKNMATQMKYVFPVLVVFISYTLSASIALYWVISNLFTIIHEMIVKRKTKALIVQNPKSTSS